MSVHVALQPLIALIAGILILLVPRLLNYVVAIYLIIVGADRPCADAAPLNRLRRARIRRFSRRGGS